MRRGLKVDENTVSALRRFRIKRGGEGHAFGTDSKGGKEIENHESGLKPQIYA